MRVQVNAFGTEGDVRPFVALARGLRAAGHAVALCTPSGFEPLLGEHDVERLVMDDAALDLIRGAMPTMRGPRDTVRVARRMTAAMRRMMLDEWRATRAWQPDLIVYHPKCLGALHVAERLDLPAVVSLPLPFLTPTAAFPVPVIGHWPLGPRANRASYAVNRFPMLAYGSMINAFRREVLGLAPRPRVDDLLRRGDGSPVPVLYAFSRHLVPVPEDYPAHVHVTGPWFLDHDRAWQPPEDLQDFLQSGPAPVYVGFGSMGFGRGREERTARLTAAVHAHGRRVLLATGWGGLAAARTTRQRHVIRSAPHDWLFPRTAAVIHHGGAGTTVAGLRAGRPTLICPFLGDQAFWGHRVHEMGAGPAPVPLRLRLAPLHHAVGRLLSDPTLTATADRLSGLIRSEDGVANAIRVIATVR